jgi:N-methylhydantoinase A
VHSGPVMGTLGSAFLGERMGERDIIVTDMGGTSFDVSVIRGGAPDLREHSVLERFEIALPMVYVDSIGAGGGSIAWLDEGGALHVGPRSAGAEPGPACYGRGGTEPTVTDANLLLGRLPGRLAGGIELDAGAAERAFGSLDPADVIAAVDAEMLRALRVVSVERGHDPREFALVAFGGAGPLHACALADELGIEAVLVPEAAGVLSALGLAASDERRDRVRSFVVPLAEAGELPAEGEADVRYAGQSFELTVPLGGDVAEAFHGAHEERYGYADRARELELVAVRTAEVTPGPDFGPVSAPAAKVAGPDVLELDGSTCWLPRGWVGARDGDAWRLTRA